MASSTSERTPRSRWTFWLVAGGWALLLCGCNKEVSKQVSVKTPQEPGVLAPSFAQLVKGESYDAAVNDDVRVCFKCHPNHVTQWASSAHAFSSFNNPIYRLVFDEYVEDVGLEKSAFCGGCHDPSLLFAGGLSKEVQPDDARGHIGVSCNGCHGIQSITNDGVGSYRLSTSPIPIPRDDDPESLQSHINRVGNPILRTNEFCIACHRGFLSQDSGHDVFVAALDEYGPWRRSPYARTESRFLAQGVEPRSCVDCHMPSDEKSKVLHSHRFTGGHTTLAAMLNESDQIAVQEEFLKNRVSVDVPVWGKMGTTGVMTSESIPLKGGDLFWFDVVVSNKAVGHQYPGGARDLRNAWIEIELEQPGSGVVATSRETPDVVPVAQKVHRFHVGMLDKSGNLVKAHNVSHFQTAAFDQTIAPFDSRVVRYQWTIPKAMQLRGKLKLKVDVLQKRLSDGFYARLCQDAKKGRGKQFIDATNKFLNKKVDPCLPQPKTIMATTKIVLGDGSNSGNQWNRWYRHGLGLKHAVQEKMELAARSLTNALREFPVNGVPAQKASIRGALAEVLIRQGRSKLALREIDELEKTLGKHPFVYRLRAKALSLIWKVQEAGKWYSAAAELAPLDDGLWRMAAISAASNSDYESALQLAWRGLELEPRDTDLLRLQLIGAKRLRAPEAIVEKAQRAFVQFQKDELASTRKARCSKLFPECRLEREPFHIHELRSTWVVGNRRR